MESLLISGPIAGSERQIAEWSDRMEALAVPPGWRKQVAPIIDHDATADDLEHNWRVGNTLRVAGARSSAIRLARDGGFRYLLMCDRDLSPATDTLHEMHACLKDRDCEVAFGLFWTAWRGGDGRMMPNVWASNHYSFTPLDKMRERSARGLVQLEDAKPFFDSLHSSRFMPVGGGGACTLIDVSRLPALCHYDPPRYFGHIVGEDRWFCARLEAHDIQPYVACHTRIEHEYCPTLLSRPVTGIQWWHGNGSRQ